MGAWLGSGLKGEARGKWWLNMHSLVINPGGLVGSQRRRGC